jgi:hypothetical protein
MLACREFRRGIGLVAPLLTLEAPGLHSAANAPA